MHLPRSSGLLLHITSLPSPYGVGDFGPQAYRFADRLERAGQSLWQVLPLVPTGLGHSPYSSPSTFAGSPLFISPDVLVEQGLLHPDDLVDRPAFSDDEADYDLAIPYKRQLLEKAFDRFEAGEGDVDQNAFWLFCEHHAGWLDDYALFMTLREAHDDALWTDWPAPLARRDGGALHDARQQHARALRKRQFWQFLFDQQWSRLRSYCAARGIRIFGDLPIYVAHDSADVWAAPHLFHLDDAGHPTEVAGVPPDYFSATGQRWGNPLYRWDRMAQNDFDWWGRRIEAALRLYDLVRLDHFRGFEAYWSIPADEETAVAGTWKQGPGAAFFEALQRRFGTLPVVAENLGEITPDVTRLMEQFNLPGMAVLQFAFGHGADHGFLPHNYPQHVIAYTGTHDNDTFLGWWHGCGEGHERELDHARRYLALNGTAKDVHWKALRALMQSTACTVVVPVQDVLGAGSEARMNVPGEGSSNWTWRLREGALTGEHASRLRELAALYGRLPAGQKQQA